jgi:acetylserotonin N-methyltransferase
MYAQENLSERASTLVMDMFNEEFPSGYDVILFSQIMHDWSTPTNVELLAKAWRALPTGGKVLLHEKLLNKERKGPLANALVTLDMLYWTEGQQYSGEELEGLLDQSGFTSIRRFPTTGYWSVVVGEKG